MKTIKILKVAFVIAFTLQIGATVALVSSPQKAWAADPTPLEFTPQVKLPLTGLNQDTVKVGSYNTKSGMMTSDLLAKYIQGFYNYGMMAASILAAIVLMGGGVLWLTSAGSDSRITQAKELIAGSITGLVILFSSWIILHTINPDLLKLKVLETKLIDNKALQSRLDCQYRCIDSGSKCEGGGGHDTIDATSPWKSTSMDICKVVVGDVPTSSCPTAKFYDCCCQNKYNATPEEGPKIMACLTGAGKAMPDGSSCYIKETGIHGYCQTIKDSRGGANKTECMTCRKTGDLCYNNVSNDYECANSQGLCGTGVPGGSNNSKYTGGDCNASPTNGSFSAQALASIEATAVTCNKVNHFGPWLFSWLTGDLETYVECKCK